ncbi:P-loop containing nucleoside triphosphate hydrolase protein [Myriangium duriaei CBS 260.36]|uniref:RNA helicase n=1 Tax=Myriangium duriaei CBS 260.36 TaxID=1168546 RepID=A0A9P4ML69_9PEZI|nr:P-loop containing nucleoside triphosphate hydrolase protein [Myriangium duriaei CBS 260.36]
MADVGQSVGDSFIPMLYKPPSLLPIAKHRESILFAIEQNEVTVIVGQTGSGKTTQIPQFLEQAGWCSNQKIIAITQPRRVAATTVAARVAEEMSCKLGQEVGYSIRFEDVTSESTKIKFLTDGLLLREALVDPLLSRYSVIMVDEAHERSLSSDILLGVLKKIKRRRSDLRIIISSATLQAEDFLHFFSRNDSDGNSDIPVDGRQNGCILKLEGRMYPVDVHYLSSPAQNYIERAVQTMFEINAGEPDGDILVFLTGRDDIETCIEMIADRLPNIPSDQSKLYPLPLYAGLSTEQQMYVFEETPENNRKVILATNIAEASVTIPSIVYVIDCGYVKLRVYNPATGIESLAVVQTSKASATQRAGRAGRTRPGKCYRLYTEAAYNAMAATSIPEIQRSKLAPIILQLQCLGIDNIARFPFLTSPPSALVVRALELLHSLGALDDYARLTKPLGYQMAELAVDPMMGKVLLSAPKFSCLPEILSIAAMTTLQGSVWVQHDSGHKALETSRWKFAVEEGDHLTLLNVYEAFITKGRKDAAWCRGNMLNFKSLSQAVSVRNQLKRYVERFGLLVEERPTGREAHAQSSERAEQIRRCLTTGYFAHAARMQPDGSYRTVDGRTTLFAHPSSLMFNRKADWVIFHEIMETGEKTFIRDITKIEKGWLTEYAPQYYKLSK